MSKSADGATIKSAYRKLAMQCQVGQIVQIGRGRRRAGGLPHAQHEAVEGARGVVVAVGGCHGGILRCGAELECTA